MANRNTFIDTNKPTWKRRPSEIRGYHRTLYYNAENNDYLRVDYHLSEKRVRLYMEIDNEGGNAYYAVISKGRITAEKSVATGRTFGFADKFKDRADIFSTIPNKDVLRLINKQYGIGRPDQKKKQTTDKRARQRRLEETRKKYFRDTGGIPEYLRDSKQKKAPAFELVDAIDIIVGSAISIGLFIYYKYSYMALGIGAGFFGIIAGILDMFIRSRTPKLVKIIPFVLLGFIFYIFGYFNPH